MNGVMVQASVAAINTADDFFDFLFKFLIFNDVLSARDSDLDQHYTVLKIAQVSMYCHLLLRKAPT